MAKAFSVASWNVEHFGITDGRSNTPVRPINPIINFLAQQQADVVAIYEVRSPDVYFPLIKAMPDHNFYMTEGPQMQEILVGVHKRLAVFVTQKLEFKSGQSSLRPGVLVTVQVDGQLYPLLFLHLKSLPDPKGFGLRDDMIRRALAFRGVLDKADPKGRANYLFLGDLNTMGFDYPYHAHDISAEQEIQELDRRCGYRHMRRLTKSHDLTWWNGNPDYLPGSNLDHVIAADHLQFKNLQGAEVSVRGWIDKSSENQQQTWISKYSDHNLLYFEVQKVL